ncbi:BlaI/MecI/CopY family transcriptional regulator [Paenibacillus sp. VCA1]|uniref:BlaI/MecI/CopY family transcriptional regulator n=1 Tax=Paenibacillus sp. VCA1 TaxID=3039148 RepID=UPI00287111D2|nr:BlaI/MecI/CopY family transcriptional regulator [Paenibacillus sp. VCA1]MDR9857414.1 BlaI/MecI/CopY family transcriptional regulator [Paenibacillus sp. VCA1]
MNTLPVISEAEWEVMKVLWQSSPMAANEVIDALASHMDWSPKTVRTLLNRLVAKGAVAYHPDSRPYSYYPLITEEECQKAETKSFLKRIYSGSLKPLLVNFLKEEQLTSADIEELRRLLDEKSDSGRRG